MSLLPSSTASRKSSGPIWIFLNLVRFLSIVSLLLVIASTIVLMVSDFRAFNAWIKAGSPSSGLSDGSTDADDGECDVIQNSTIPNQFGGLFYSILSRLFMLQVTVTLLLSEVGGPRMVRRFFELFFPPLGPAHGLAVLGFIECFVATIILSHSLPLFSVISCWFLFALGCINILLGYSGSSIKATRQIFAFEGPPPSLSPRPFTILFNEGKHPTPHTKYTALSKADGDRKYVSFGGAAQDQPGHGVKPVGWGGFGKKAENEARLKGYLISKPMNVTPKA